MTNDETRNHLIRSVPGVVIRHLLLGVLFCVLLSRGLYAATNASARLSSQRLTVDTWTTQKGLPESSVFSLLQTRDGYLWVGTGYGLARFDGIHFNTFDESEEPALSSEKIVRLFEDSRGTLWIGTEKAGIFMVGREGKVQRLVEAGTGDQGKLVAICEDASGAIWLSTAVLQVARFQNRHLEVIATSCNGLTADNSGLVWIGALLEAKTRKGKLIGLGPIPKTPMPALAVAHEIPVTNLDYLLGSKQGGYWRVADNRVQKCRQGVVEKDFGHHSWPKVTSACEDLEGNLVVGTYGDGVYWLNKEGKFIHVEGLPSSYIFSVCMDQEGSLWVGTDARGLNRVRNPVFDTFEKPRRGLATTSACADNEDGLWFAVNNDGVKHWHNGNLQEYKENQGLSDLYVRAVLMDSKSNVWVGTLEGLFQLSDKGFTNVEPWRTVSVIHQDKTGQVWFGTDEGLHCRSPRKDYTMTNGLTANVITAVADDKSDNLWIGTPSGLNRVRAGQLTAFHRTNGLPSDNISALYVDADNILWVGTSRGLARFDGTNWTAYPKDTGLLAERISYLIEDQEHFLWVGSLAGLVRIDKQDLNIFAAGKGRIIGFRSYGVEDGLPNSQCSAGSQPAAAVTRNGTLWFPTIEGLVFVRPDQIRRNTNPPPVRIEAVKVHGKLQSANTLRASAPERITIEPRQEGLEIAYTSLNLSAPERARFRHRLTPVQAAWIEAENVRVAQYPTLPPGKYRFEVTACNEDGTWNEIGSKLAVTVLPPFWRTPWFITLATPCRLKD